jgi:hypothetical protein
MKFKQHEKLEKYFAKMDKVKSIPELRQLEQEFQHALLKEKNDGEQPLKYADLEQARLQELSLLAQRWAVEFKQKEHTLVDAYSKEYGKAMDQLEKVIGEKLTSITPLLNEVYELVDELLDHQKGVAEMSRDIQVYRYRNYQVDGRHHNGYHLPFGPLGVSGDSLKDRNRKTMQIIVGKYLEIRSPAEPVPADELTKMRPDPHYFHQGK